MTFRWVEDLPFLFTYSRSISRPPYDPSSWSRDGISGPALAGPSFGAVALEMTAQAMDVHNPANGSQ